MKTDKPCNKKTESSYEGKYYCDTHIKNYILKSCEHMMPSGKPCNKKTELSHEDKYYCDTHIKKITIKKCEHIMKTGNICGKNTDNTQFNDKYYCKTHFRIINNDNGSENNNNNNNNNSNKNEVENKIVITEEASLRTTFSEEYTGNKSAKELYIENKFLHEKLEDMCEKIEKMYSYYKCANNIINEDDDNDDE
jgi:hypothetical protein